MPLSKEETEAFLRQPNVAVVATVGPTASLTPSLLGMNMTAGTLSCTRGRAHGSTATYGITTG